jgi:AP-1 complex subunit sigma 1/2
MIHCFFLINRQGKIRLTKWYSHSYTTKEKAMFLKEINNIVLTRGPKLCNFLNWKDFKIVYKKYASLYFICLVDQDDNQLAVLETMHHFVEVLDKYFNSVCELDLIFNFHKAYFVLDELLMAGFVQESSKKVIIKAVAGQEALIGESLEELPKAKK